MELRLERMEIVEEGAVFYYTLIFPLLTKGSLFPTFSVEQTAFFSDGHHYMLDLPKKLARIDGQFAEFQCAHSIFGLTNYSKIIVVNMIFFIFLISHFLIF